MKLIGRFLRGFAVWTLIVLLALGNIITWGAMMGFPAAQFWVAFSLQALNAPNHAIYWYTRSFGNGCWQAADVVAWFSLTGRYGLPQDDELAHLYFIAGSAFNPADAVVISVFGYHGAVGFDASNISMAKGFKEEHIIEVLNSLEELADWLPFKLDKEGYLKTWKALK